MPQSDWHPFMVVLPEGSEDELAIELDCDGHGCPTEGKVGGYYRCVAEYAVESGFLVAEPGLAPGAYRMRINSWRDHRGEWDEDLDIVPVPTAP